MELMVKLGSVKFLNFKFKLVLGILYRIICTHVVYIKCG